MKHAKQKCDIFSEKTNMKKSITDLLTQTWIWYVLPWFRQSLITHVVALNRVGHSTLLKLQILWHILGVRSGERTKVRVTSFTLCVIVSFPLIFRFYVSLFTVVCLWKQECMGLESVKMCDVLWKRWMIQNCVMTYLWNLLWWVMHGVTDV